MVDITLVVLIVVCFALAFVTIKGLERL